ncbi:hypothetical protein BX604_7555 [Burkholderia sp. JKS000303]|nr:hypothetical protein BX604_7555 [Burkholderia sp. JKS000303]
MRYFSDWNGQSVLLKGITTMPNKEFAARYPDVKGMRSDGYSRYAGWADDGSGVVSQKRCPQSQFVVFEQLTASDRLNGVSGIAQGGKESRNIYLYRLVAQCFLNSVRSLLPRWRRLNRKFTVETCAYELAANLMLRTALLVGVACTCTSRRCDCGVRERRVQVDTNTIPQGMGPRSTGNDDLQLGSTCTESVTLAQRTLVGQSALFICRRQSV